MPFSTVSASRPFLEIDRLRAEEFAPPAFEGRHVVLLAAGDGFEIVHVGDEFRRDALGIGDLLQQDLQELDRRTAAPAVAAPVALDPRKALRVSGEAALDRRQHVGSEPRFVHAARHGPEIAERIERFRRSTRDFEQGVVLEDPRAGHVPRLGLRLAPGRDLHQHRKVARSPHLGSKPLPGIFRMLLIGRDGRERPHLVGEPAGSPRALELFDQRPIDVAQVGHVGQRVADLSLRQRPASPVGEAR